ncbi:hypothetical protein PROFUN_08237 [Planoprotostelium fungivorum]|uniref:Uncharacterized protein n=1 Tax=Planoprotostelium fungivorum TaxID=1890364 RepID=A0A2P6NKB6_9EUKA|nr:hypothetical protein PROFUN_08237 [Planoprotostelium fungivorum]
MLNTFLLFTLFSAAAAQYGVEYGYPNASCTGATTASASVFNACINVPINGTLGSTILTNLSATTVVRSLYNVSACQGPILTNYTYTIGSCLASPAPAGFESPFYFFTIDGTFSRRTASSQDSITESYSSNTTCSNGTFVGAVLSYGNCNSTLNHTCQADASSNNVTSSTVRCGNNVYVLPGGVVTTSTSSTATTSTSTSSTSTTSTFTSSTTSAASTQTNTNVNTLTSTHTSTADGVTIVASASLLVSIIFSVI